ncbi:MAG: cold-shock protein [Candidatus Azotimanducaceae bacterium WSBS_2022_MAG_OTU7]
MLIIKKIAISIVIGLIAYEITKLSLNGSIQIPDTMPEISLLLLFIATSFASQFIGDVSASAATSAKKSFGSGKIKNKSRYASSDRELGTVKWFNTRKGYGFITRATGDDVFVHFRNIEGIEGKGRRAIEEGQPVSFVVITGDKGLQADEVLPA